MEPRLMKELKSLAVSNSVGKKWNTPDNKIMYAGGIQRVCVSIPGINPFNTLVRIIPFIPSSKAGLKNKTSSGQITGMFVWNRIEKKEKRKREKKTTCLYFIESKYTDSFFETR